MQPSESSAAHVLLCLARWESGRPYPCVLPKGHDGQHQHPMDPVPADHFLAGFNMKPATDAQPVDLYAQAMQQAEARQIVLPD